MVYGTHGRHCCHSANLWGGRMRHKVLTIDLKCSFFQIPLELNGQWWYIFEVMVGMKVMVGMEGRRELFVMTRAAMGARPSPELMTIIMRILVRRVIRQTKSERTAYKIHVDNAIFIGPADELERIQAAAESRTQTNWRRPLLRGSPYCCK
jgi:hypothetical protein